MKKVILLSLLTVVLSCDNDGEEPIPQKYFEVDIDPSFLTNQSDDWVILHDQNGILLDAKAFEAGDMIVFDTTGQILNNKIAVTFLRVPQDGTESYQFQSFLCEDTNVKWTLKSGSPIIDFGNPVGQLSVKVIDSDIGSGHDTQMSNRYTTFAFPTMDPNNAGSLIFPTVEVTSTVDDFFIYILDKNGIPHYKFLKDVVPGALEYSLDDFNGFDQVVEVSFPSSVSAIMFVKGYDGDVIPSQGYYTNFSLSGLTLSKPQTSFNIGYLNDFSKYSTQIHVGYTGYSLSFAAVGSIPTSIELKDSFTATVTDNSFDEYSVSSVDYDWRQSSWYYSGKKDGKDVAIGWNVTASPEHFKNPTSLPQAILDKYPLLDLNFQYQNTTFYKGDRTFEDVVNERFKGSAIKDYTLYSKTAFN